MVGEQKQQEKRKGRKVTLVEGQEYTFLHYSWETALQSEYEAQYENISGFPGNRKLAIRLSQFFHPWVHPHTLVLPHMLEFSYKVRNLYFLGEGEHPEVSVIFHLHGTRLQYLFYKHAREHTHTHSDLLG